MSKTVDELMEAFRTGFRQRMQGPGIRPEGDIAIRAGIAAVVAALRDELSIAHNEGGFMMATTKQCNGPAYADWRINQILGDAGNEKVAGGSTREDEKAVEAAGDKGPVTVNSPATDPCPRCGYPAQDQCDSPECNTDPAPAARSDATAVCEWTHRGVNESGFYSTPHGLCHINHLPKSGGCWCGNPIKFTEAQR